LIDQLKQQLQVEGKGGLNLTLDQKKTFHEAIEEGNCDGSCQNQKYRSIKPTIDPMKTTSPNDIKIARFATTPSQWLLLQRYLPPG
jgi:hypothetical protein